MKNTEEKTSRMTVQQREVMLGFMKEHENFARGRISNLGPEGAKIKAKLIENLANELNSLPNGATKSGEKWMKSWQDWRSDIKSKAAKIKRSLNGTGGGPPTKITLTPLEEELMAFLGQVVAEGLSTVADPLEAEASGRASALNNMVWEEVGGNVQISLDMASVSVLQCDPTPPKPAIISLQRSQRSLNITTPSSPEKRRKRKYTRSDAFSPYEVPDKLLQLSEEQKQLLKRKIELKEAMVAIQRQSLVVQEKQAAAIENAAISFTDTMKTIHSAIKMWLEKH